MLQLSTAVRNALLDAIETAIGASAVLKIYTGAMPANVAAARTGTVLCSMSLPSDWMAAASSGAKAKSGTWEDTSADATGLAGYFTVFASDGTTAHIQGLCGQNWAASTTYALNQQVVNDSGKVYKCTTAGTTASSGGPTGTSSGITDGSAVWEYVGTSDLVLVNGSIAATQAVNVSTFSVTAPGA